MCYNGHAACVLALASALCGKLDTKVYYVGGVFLLGAIHGNGFRSLNLNFDFGF